MLFSAWRILLFASQVHKGLLQVHGRNVHIAARGRLLCRGKLIFYTGELLQSCLDLCDLAFQLCDLCIHRCLTILYLRDSCRQLLLFLFKLGTSGCDLFLSGFYLLFCFVEFRFACIILFLSCIILRPSVIQLCLCRR